MMKKAASILAAVAVLAGCNPSSHTEDNSAYSISGEIMDPDASLSRLLADMHVTATEKSSGKIHVGSVGTEDSKTCRYLLENIPSGEYVLKFTSLFYEAAEYSVDLKGDKTLDVSLSPIPQISLDVQEIHIAPREKATVFSVTNLTTLDCPFFLDKPVESLYEFIGAAVTAVIFNISVFAHMVSVIISAFVSVSYT